MKRCPKCRSTDIYTYQRGFNWFVGLTFGIFFLLLFPPLALLGLLGLCGRKELRFTCKRCKKKWR